MEDDFVGKGFAFPMGIDHRGGIATLGGGESLDAAIAIVLGTAPGERVMRPDFGCAVWDMLFDPINETTLGRMAQAVRDAVGRWEPRAELEDVDVQPDPQDPARVLISVVYRVKATNDRRNLVFPFYVIPDEVAS